MAQFPAALWRSVACKTIGDTPREAGILFDPALPLPTPHIINLISDPKERELFNAVYGHTGTMAHFGRIFRKYQETLKREPLVPAGAPLTMCLGREAGGSAAQFLSCWL